MSNSQSKRITIVVPCFGRPQRTRRMVDCIFSQDIREWELFLIGDNCDHFQRLKESDYLLQKEVTADYWGNKIHAFNFGNHHGGYGYAAINFAIRNARGKYFIFAGNDDIIYPDHFKHYLSGIEDTDYDFVFYNTWVDVTNKPRHTNLAPGGIGHSELIIRTEFLKKMPPHGPEYGHDWQLVKNMMVSTANYRKVEDSDYTYKIMSIKNKTNDIID